MEACIVIPWEDGLGLFTFEITNMAFEYMKKGEQQFSSTVMINYGPYL